MSLQKPVHGRNLAEDVKAIPVLIPLPSTGDMTSPRGITEDDMGKNDPNTINYINIRTNDIPPGHEFRITQVEEMIDLTHRWLDIQAGIQTYLQKEKGTLPTDMSSASQLKRSDYRIKVVDTIMTEGLCRWINFSKDEPTNYNIKVKKSEFHTHLLRDMLVGITTVSAISSAIEGALKSLSDTIIQTQSHIQGKSVWSFFNVFTWDDVNKDVKGSIRIVWYNVSGEMVEYTVHKASYEEAKMIFGYPQTDYTFVDNLWASSEQPLRDFLTEYGSKKIRDPIDGEIAP